jgi:hypothetical protein
MRIGTFVVKIWRWVSIAFVIGALGWTYSLLPDMVAFDFSETGLADSYINRDVIFYIVMGLFLVNNVVISSLVKAVPRIDLQILPILNKETWAKNRSHLNELIINWIYCIIAGVNTMIGLSLFSLATVNSNQFKMDIFDFSWLFYMGLLLMILIFLLPLRLLFAPAPQDEL